MRMMLMWRAGGELAWCLVDTCDSLLWAKLSYIHLLTHNADEKMKAIKMMGTMPTSSKVGGVRVGVDIGYNGKPCKIRTKEASIHIWSALHKTHIFDNTFGSATGFSTHICTFVKIMHFDTCNNLKPSEHVKVEFCLEMKLLHFLWFYLHRSCRWMNSLRRYLFPAIATNQIFWPSSRQWLMNGLDSGALLKQRPNKQ